jgi:pyrroloquinoline quinone (PQQ) biosynthesis protein C
MFVGWADAFGISKEELFDTPSPPNMTAITDWCWHICHAGDLATAMAATNFAIEGVTGEWCPRLYQSAAYWQNIPDDKRVSGMAWVKAHADYDDAHPWEAMDIISQLVGPTPPRKKVLEILGAVQKIYKLHLDAFDAVSTPQSVSLKAG